MTLYRVSESEVFQLLAQRDFAKENYEEQLENWILHNPGILTEGENILFIKREKSLEKSEDLLGIDEEGNTVIIELKRGRTPRMVIAQALEYASRVSRLGYRDLDKIALKFFTEIGLPYKSLHEALCDYFETIYQDDLEKLVNKSQRIILVAQDISEDVLNTADYLREYGINIRCVSFRYYKEGNLVIVDLDPDVRGSYDVPVKSSPSRISSDTEKFLLLVREQILDRYSDKVFYATQKPNRVVSFWLDQNGFLSVGISLESDEKLTYNIMIVYEDLEKNKHLCENIKEKIESQGETVYLEDKKKEKLQLYSIFEWNEQLLIDDGFIHDTVERLSRWVGIVEGEAREDN